MTDFSVKAVLSFSGRGNIFPLREAGPEMSNSFSSFEFSSNSLRSLKNLKNITHVQLKNIPMQVNELLLFPGLPN